MDKKILLALIILFAISCAGIVSAVNETNDTLEVMEEPIDTANYIMPTAISGNRIQFSDGFTGFCIDLTKDSITGDDGFTVGSASDATLENYIKLAIIECYKQNRENDIEEIVASFVDGSYQSKSDDVISEVLNSGKTIGSVAVEEIDNTSEATFTFEHLTSADDEKSDCIAYTVSLKTIEKEDVLGASESDDKVTDGDDSKSDETALEESGEKETQSDDAKPKSETENIATQPDDGKTTGEEPIINETNKTVINKTNTVIINEKNTTIINKTNVKHIKNTTDDSPQNETIQEAIMKTAGNPIFLLAVVTVVAVIAAVVMRRRD